MRLQTDERNRQWWWWWWWWCSTYVLRSIYTRRMSGQGSVCIEANESGTGSKQASWQDKIRKDQTRPDQTRHQTPDTRHQTPDTRHQTPDTRQRERLGRPNKHKVFSIPWPYPYSFLAKPYPLLPSLLLVQLVTLSLVYSTLGLFWSILV